MLIKFKGKEYILVLKKKVIPVALTRIVRNLYNEPKVDFSAESNRLEGEVAVVTGGNRGIGLAIAKRLLRDGAKVIITGRNDEQLSKVCDDIGSPNLAFLKWDIADTSQCSEYFRKAESMFGRISILVNNAGVTTNSERRLSFEEMDVGHYHFVHDVNTIGTRQMCITYSELFDKGTILNILSNTSLRPAQDAYFTSKWAIRSFTEKFGLKCMYDGKEITVNGLCPGPIKTDMTFVKGTMMYRMELPNHRIGYPEEIAELAVVQIISGLKFGMNGKITVCDGGELLN